MEKKKILKAESSFRRLDLFLSERIPELSRSEIAKLIKEGAVQIDDKIVSKKNIPLEAGNRVEIRIDEKEDYFDSYSPSQALTKLFEDESLLIIDKPAGLMVHPGSGNREETVLDLFMFYYPEVQNITDSERPGIVHRLDKETTGILILAKNDISMIAMQNLFKNRLVKKTYTAIVHGKPRFLNGTIDLPIDRSKKNKTKFTVSTEETAREAITDYTLIQSNETISTIALYPHTGRTHQLRVHMAHQKTPILGDRLYGKRDNESHMYLHASGITFEHPHSGQEISIESTLPSYFKERMAR